MSFTTAASASSSKKRARYATFKNIANLHQFDFGDHVSENVTTEDVVEMLANVKAGRRVVLMVFSNNCGPCALVDEEFLRLAVKYPDYGFYREEVNRGLSPGVSHLPTFRIIGPGGKFEAEIRSSNMIALENAIRANAIAASR